MVIRKYTPPTCTLEIKAKNSPLSRWAGRSVLNQLRFELSFDDPRQPEEKRVTIWGDRTELEALYEAVTTYIQTFLSQSPALISARSLKSAVPIAESLSTQLILAGSQEVEVEDLLSPQIPITLAPRQKSPLTFYLQPRGILIHDLFLGPLATEESGPFVSLSALQLFDFATALDEYVSEMVALPHQISPPKWLQAPPPWTKAAAMVMVTVGLTTAAIKLLEKVDTPVKNGAQTPSPAQQPTAVAQASPIPIPPPPSPPVSIPSLPTPLTSTRVPPPARVVAPPPRNSSQLPLVIPEAGKSLPRGSSQPLVITEAGKAPPLPRSSAALKSRTVLTQSSSSKTPVKLESAPRQPTKVAQTQEQPAPTPAPTIASLPSPPSLSYSRSKKEGAPRGSLPQLNASPPIPPVPDAPATDGAGRSASVSTQPSQAGGSLASHSGTKSRLFDTIPQVAEVRNYFQQRWKPPAELTQSLEYNLVLNGNGSVDRVTPLGSTAATYIDRTNMPTLGAPFVSPLEKKNAPIVRLLLYPDGRVETFLQGTN